jgi:hypothetical protein
VKRFFDLKQKISSVGKSHIIMEAIFLGLHVFVRISKIFILFENNIMK